MPNLIVRNSLYYWEYIKTELEKHRDLYGFKRINLDSGTSSRMDRYHLQIFWGNPRYNTWMHEDVVLECFVEATQSSHEALELKGTLYCSTGRISGWSLPVLETQIRQVESLGTQYPGTQSQVLDVIKFLADYSTFIDFTSRARSSEKQLQCAVISSKLVQRDEKKSGFHTYERSPYFESPYSAAHLGELLGMPILGEVSTRRVCLTLDERQDFVLHVHSCGFAYVVPGMGDQDLMNPDEGIKRHRLILDKLQLFRRAYPEHTRTIDLR